MVRTHLAEVGILCGGGNRANDVGDRREDGRPDNDDIINFLLAAVAVSPPFSLSSSSAAAAGVDKDSSSLW